MVEQTKTEYHFTWNTLYVLKRFDVRCYSEQNAFNEKLTINKFQKHFSTCILKLIWKVFSKVLYVVIFTLFRLLEMPNRFTTKNNFLRRLKSQHHLELVKIVAISIIKILTKDLSLSYKKYMFKSVFVSRVVCLKLNSISDFGKIYTMFHINIHTFLNISKTQISTFFFWFRHNNYNRHLVVPETTILTKYKKRLYRSVQ